MQSRTDYVEALEDSGYARIGGFSCFAQVYAKPGEPHVVKVGMDEKASKDGWLAYAQWLLESGETNPHFPRVESLDVFHGADGKPRWFAAKIERLEEVVGDDEDAPLRSSTETASAALYAPEKTVSLPGDLADAIVKIRNRFGGKWMFDLHSANAMARPTDAGRVLVLTDPISFPTGAE